MSSFHRLADNWLPTIADASLVASAVTLAGGVWKAIRFVGLLRLFKRWCVAANARLGVVVPMGVRSERERRIVEGHTSASERAGPPMLF